MLADLQSAILQLRDHLGNLSVDVRIIFKVLLYIQYDVLGLMRLRVS